MIRAALSKSWNHLLRAAGAINRIKPIVAVPAVFFYGVFLYILAYPLDLARVCGIGDDCVIEKQIGYTGAINWVGVTILILPCLIFFLLAVSRSFGATFDSLAERGMLVDSERNPVAPRLPQKEWQKFLDKMRLPLAIFLVIAVCQPIVEWVGTSARPLMSKDIAQVSEEEYDWSVAEILRQPPGNCWERTRNGLFSLLVFASQSIMIIAVAYLFSITFLLCAFLHEHRATWQIIPDLSDPDPRRGFQLFEEPITNLITAGLLAIAMFYLSTVHNYYLRTTYPTLPEFLVEDVVAGSLSLARNDNSGSIPHLLNPAPSQLRSDPENFSAGATRLGGLIVILLVWGAPLWILRGVAMRGKLIIKQKAGKILTMRFWPLSYLSLNGYLLLCTVAGLSLLYYRVGLWVFGVLFGVTIARVISVATRAISEKPAAAEEK